MSQKRHRHYHSPAPEEETTDEVDTLLPFSSSGARYNEWFGEWRGRRIRRIGKGGWPCDEPELERQEAEYYLLRLLLGHLLIGPVYDVLQSQDDGTVRVLDVVTGTGIWAIEMAELFPHAEVIGLDTVPIQHQMAPVNCEFDIDTFTHTLPYASSSFALIHFSFDSYHPPHYPSLLRSAWICLRPNGLLLLYGRSGPASTASGRVPRGVQAWEDAFKRGSKWAGWEAWELKRLLGEGWVREGKVEGSEVSVPIGSHDDGRKIQLGRIHLINTRAYLDSARYVMVKHGRYTDAEVDVLCEAYMADVEREKLYSRYCTVSIRKPGE